MKIQQGERRKRFKTKRNRKTRVPKEPNTDEPDFIYDLVREDGRLERVCEHGIGHTVGHLRPAMLLEDWIWIHGCDGCCGAYSIQKSACQV